MRFDGRGPRDQRGTVAVASLAAGTFTNVSVTFPVPFATAPLVVPVPANSRLTAGVSAVSTTGFTIVYANWTSGVAPATDINWIAFAV